MRSDLQEALVPVKWAEAQIPILQDRFIAWQRRSPYELVMEPDPDDPKWEFLTAYLRKPVDAEIVGDIGAIINSTRTALDILIVLLLESRCIKPKRGTYFPIRETSADFLAAVHVLETEHGISAAEGAEIKRNRAYRGGDNFLYPLHKLDILRKHHRVLVVEPVVDQAKITLLNGFSYAARRNLKDKTILYRIPAQRFRPSKGDTLLAAEIFIDEPSLLPPSKQPARLVLGWFTGRVRTLIEKFP